MRLKFVGTTAALLSLFMGTADAATISLRAGPVVDNIFALFRSDARSITTYLFDMRNIPTGLCTQPVLDAPNWKTALKRMLTGTGVVPVFRPRIVGFRRVRPPDPSAYCQPGVELAALPGSDVDPTLDLSRREGIPTTRRDSDPRPSAPRIAPADQCICAYTIEPTGAVMRGPWCKHEDGRADYVPERCPLP